MAKMGRPKANIDKDQFEKLCAMQCPYNEISAWFGVCEDTLNAWCKREYGGKTFSEVSAEKRGRGKISVRRKQYETAMKGDVKMLIWLGKNWLGQSDSGEREVEVDKTKDPLTTALDEELNNGTF